MKIIRELMFAGLISVSLAGCGTTDTTLEDVLDVANVVVNTAIGVENIRRGGSGSIGSGVSAGPGYTNYSSRAANPRSEGSGDFCSQVSANYRNCEASWNNIGGGSSGQAGSFKQCMETYRNAAIAGGCSL